MRRTDFARLLRRVALGACTALAAAAHAATIEVINADPPGVGFNDPTPALPVGGNTGTTLGEQRRIVFAFVADFWGRRLNSDVPIQVLASFAPLDCDATSGVLGAAGAFNVFADFPNGRPATWYPSALANKLAGVRLANEPNPLDNVDIGAFFNGDIGRPGCLEGLSFYLGLDSNEPPTQIDLLTTVLHEFGHGLGFQTFTDDATGQFFPGDAFPDLQFPSIWDYFLLDPRQRRTWAEMTDAQRVRSAITPRNLVWNGRNVTRASDQVLDRGTPTLFVAGAGLDNFYTIGEAEFGPPIDTHLFLTAQLARVVDQPDGTGLACTPLSPANAAAVRGKVAVVDRGVCVSTLKVKNAQDAGAKAVLVVENTTSVPPLPLFGVDPTIRIPSARIARADGREIKAAIDRRGRDPVAVLFGNGLTFAGADLFERVFMYTPNPNEPGSSVSHFDTLARPNLLMEPFASATDPIAVAPPRDLTLPLLQDIGW